MVGMKIFIVNFLLTHYKDIGETNDHLSILNDNMFENENQIEVDDDVRYTVGNELKEITFTSANRKEDIREQFYDDIDQFEITANVSEHETTESVLLAEDLVKPGIANFQ